ncbi:MAG: hypothetical protein A3E78_02530 [Alphaproteobacteria bacterium RIFCSPHIGHO2_12_FULL_63_12]|nr:MAG: hypothetical protein A3E78_02530 [Alphaproteobacteria bacterium RIFCSPHIGHO2_12_FULL_63_12]
MTKRDKYLRRTYGLTECQFLKMVAAQGGVCAICQRAPKPRKRLHVDHDHKTGRVRGALCFHCNHRLLGRGRENPEQHQRAAAYLLCPIDWRQVA